MISNPTKLRYSPLLLLLALLHTSVASSEALNIITSIRPIQSLVANLTQGVTEPKLLIRGAQSPHTFTFRPSDGRKLQQAALVVWVGEALETSLSDKLPTLAKNARIVTLLDEPHDNDKHQHHHDAHIWLSPQLISDKVPVILQALLELDPDHAEQYKKNAYVMLQKLQVLDANIKHQLAPFKHIPYVVFHDAYGHYERQYGLNNMGAITLSPERQPGAKRVAELTRKIKTHGVRCLFTEPQFQPKLAQMIAQSTHSSIGLLDPIGIDLPAGPEGYFLLIQKLTDSFVTCLQSAGK